jgi:hypothetical protein
MCVPNLFSKKPIPDEMPSSMQKVVNQLKRCRSREECARKAYDIVSTRFRAGKWSTYLRLFDLFRYDIDFVWNHKGFHHCTNLNYALRILLVKSGKFKEEDIIPKFTLVYYFHPHQYFKVNVGRGKIINVDVWGSYFGVPYGDYSLGFNCYRATSKKADI